MKKESLDPMIEFILDIDWLTTSEFCAAYHIPIPTAQEGVQGLLRVDSVKHRMFVEHAKKLHRSKKDASNETLS